MSSVAVNPVQQEPQADGWERLIPGEAPACREAAQKKRAAKTVALWEDLARDQDEGSSPSDSALALLAPAPLQSRIAQKWLTSLSLDWALMGFNWLLAGAMLVPLHRLFPHVSYINRAIREPLALLGIAVLHAALITLVGHTEGLYGNLQLKQQTRILGKSVVLATAVLCCAYIMQGEHWARGALCCVAGAIHYASLRTWRWQSAQRNTGEPGEDARNVLIVGAGRVGRRVAAYLEDHPEGGRRVYGFLDDEKPLGAGVIGHVRDLARMSRMGFVDEVILAAPKNNDLTLRVLSETRRLHLDLEIVPELFGCTPVGNEIEKVGGLPVICLHAEHLPALHLVLKRIVDILGAGLVVSALSPLLAVIALLIKLDSAGPVFYCAPRAGRKGKLFRCYKFRTMVLNADELKLQLRRNNERSGPFFKIERDPRITRIGGLLRRYSLDELPQLWNVLRGEMSLVGPRPHPLDDVAEYEIEHLARLDVTPGITGLWQVTARRDPSFQRGMELDREYIRRWSLGLDMKILLRTFVAVVQGSGD